jgi:hypothetical protein
LPAKRSLDFSSPVASKLPSSQVGNNTAISDNDIPFTPNLPPMNDLLTPVNNKRTADELFGDIGDIDFDSVELPSKRQKTDEENDLELIEKILESRRLKQLMLEPSRVQCESKQIYDAKDNLSLDIPRFVHISAYQNTHCYVL